MARVSQIGASQRARQSKRKHIFCGWSGGFHSFAANTRDTLLSVSVCAVNVSVRIGDGARAHLACAETE